MIWLEEKYLSLVSSRLANYKVVKRSPFVANFSCSYCGDSHTNKNKARGYIYEKKGNLFYRCHNCGMGRTFNGFLKDISPENFKAFYTEKFKESSRSYFSVKKEEPVPEPVVEEVVEEQEYLGVPVTSLLQNHEALRYLAGRKIPKKRWSELYYVDDLGKLEKTFGDAYEWDNLPKDKRIVFPIRNRRGELIGISARAITKTKLRYVILKKKDDTMVFNLDKIDIGKQVYALEGAIDSMFFDNAIAVDGSDFMKLAEIVPKANLTVIVDNENRNKEIVEKMRKISDAGFKMVIWPDWVKQYGKDINEMIISGLSIEKITETINENTFSGLKCKLALAKWRN